MRVLGLDLGTKRIGIALSDASGTVASPLMVLTRGSSRRGDHARIAELVIAEEVERVVVGLPLTMTGEHGAAAQAAISEIKALATVVHVPVETHDERLSTVTAERSLTAAGVHGSARRQIVDKVAAAVILQSWLDARRVASEAGRS